MITIDNYKRASKKILKLHKSIDSNYDGDKYVGPTLMQVQHNVARQSGLKKWSDLLVLSQEDLECAYSKFISAWY